uniref:Uncharacterized protein n=1 Tax=Oryza sativa subsp. japonica TaxID=39947 RepID=Q8GRR5_ORYSJ|nr:hypothetical protein [Oryza sativa Japonica Group]BAD31327.1 hypothetical protein [Oryza sativa Japonica Group]
MGVARVCLDRRSLAADRRGGGSPWPRSPWRRWIGRGRRTSVSRTGCGSSRRGRGRGTDEDGGGSWWCIGNWDVESSRVRESRAGRGRENKIGSEYL